MKMLLQIATSSDHPSPWLWTVPTTNGENTLSQPESAQLSQQTNGTDLEPVSFAAKLDDVRLRKCKRFSAVASAAFRNAMRFQGARFACFIL